VRGAHRRLRGVHAGDGDAEPHRRGAAAIPRAVVIAALVAGGAVATLLVPAAPGYDAWAWLTWGRELTEGSLSTQDGPAFKPLPVAVCALLAPLGGAAPEAWLVVARAGALAALVLAALLAVRVSVRPPWRWAYGHAPVLAVAGVALTGGFVRHAMVGDAEPLLVALLLGAGLAALDGRDRTALVLGAAAALVRVEVWPFLLVALLARRAWRPALALAVVLPAAWFGPELAASGELLRSTGRALTPNPGQPATAGRPALAVLELALTASLVLPLAVAALAAPRGPARALAAAGAAWIALVALMSEAGFAGEARYLLPGSAVVAVAGAASLARAPAALAAVALVVAVLPRAADLESLPHRLAHQHRLATGVERAIAAAGGPAALAGCGRPAVGRYRGTLLAWHLRVPKHRVRADGRPADVTFLTRLTPGAAGPAAPRIAYSAGSSCTSERTGAKRSPRSSTRASTAGASNASRSGSPASRHARTSSQSTGVETVGRSRARSE
jgi:hypothetical protein